MTTNTGNGRVFPIPQLGIFNDKGPRYATTASNASTATNDSPTARWAITVAPGSSLNTVAPPSPAWAITSPKASVAGTTTQRSRRYRTQAAMHRKSIRGPTTNDAVIRWEYSMMALVSRGGKMPPSQPGQSGQPRPDSVTRTTPPRMTKAKVARTVNAAIPRNQS